MKKTVLLLITFITAFSLSGCVSQKDYDLLLEERDSLQTQLTTQQEENAKLKEEIESSKGQIDELNQELTDANDKIDELNESLSEFEELLKTVQEELAETKLEEAETENKDEANAVTETNPSSEEKKLGEALSNYFSGEGEIGDVTEALKEKGESLKKLWGNLSK